MRASTEEFLYVLWFLSETLMRPTYRNLTELNFEGWAWRTGLGRRLAQLERRKLVAPHPARASDSARIVSLTTPGRLAALAGRDPAVRWARPWDGIWRLVLFDLPRDSAALRSRLHRWLRARHFGFLQGSVWLTPDSVDDLRAAQAEVPIEPEGFLVVAARPAGGERDAALVCGAWDFAEINRRYQHHLAHLRRPPARHRRDGPAGLRTWLRLEHAYWKEAVNIDPLLPQALLPQDYLGRAAWSARRETLATLLRPSA